MDRSLGDDLRPGSNQPDNYEDSQYCYLPDNNA